MKSLKSLHVGAHRSIQNGILNVIKNTVDELGGNAIQIFNGSNRSAKLSAKTKLTDAEKSDIKNYVANNNIYLVIHSIYLLNLCHKGSTIKFMLDNLVKDVETADEIGAHAVVLHTGFKLKMDTEEAYKNMYDNVVHVIERTKTCKALILLETPAGQGSAIATSLEDFAKLYNMFPSKYAKRLGVCIDTAHIFASGIDVSQEDVLKKYLRDFNKLIGTKCIKLFHINDSQKPLNSRRDLHEDIGKGYIFEKKISLKYIVQFSVSHNIPLILETRGNHFKEEIHLLKSLV